MINPAIRRSFARSFSPTVNKNTEDLSKNNHSFKNNKNLSEDNNLKIDKKDLSKFVDQDLIDKKDPLNDLTIDSEWCEVRKHIKG